MASMHKAATSILMDYERSPLVQSPAVTSPSPPSTTLPAPKGALLSTTGPSSAMPVEEGRTMTEASTSMIFTRPAPAIETDKVGLQNARGSRKRSLEVEEEEPLSPTKRSKHSEPPQYKAPPRSITDGASSSTPDNTSTALLSAATATRSSATTLSQVCSHNLSGKGPWNASTSLPCNGKPKPCSAKFHICKKYRDGVKRGNINACGHGGDGVDHWDSASQVTWVHVRPTCRFEMRDSKSPCADSCVFAHRRDCSTEEWQVRMTKAEESGCL